jgi:hypothetical protein
MKVTIEIEVGKNMTDEEFKAKWIEEQVSIKLCALIEANIECFVFKVKVD